MIALAAGCLALVAVAVALGMPPAVAVAVAAGCFAILAATIGRRFRRTLSNGTSPSG